MNIKNVFKTGLIVFILLITTKLYPAIKGPTVKTITFHNVDAGPMAFHPSGNFLVSVNANNSITLYYFSNKQEPSIRELPLDIDTNAVTFSSNGEFLASKSDGGVIKLWNLTKMECIYTLCHVTAFIFNPDNKFLISTHSTKKIMRLNLETMSDESYDFEYGDTVLDLAFDPIEGLIATVNLNNTIKIFNLAQKTFQNTFIDTYGIRRSDYLKISQNGNVMITQNTSYSHEYYTTREGDIMDHDGSFAGGTDVKYEKTHTISTLNILNLTTFNTCTYQIDEQFWDSKWDKEVDINRVISSALSPNGNAIALKLNNRDLIILIDAQSTKSFLAFLLGQHPRVGAGSPVNSLTPELFKIIYDMHIESVWDQKEIPHPASCALL